MTGTPLLESIAVVAEAMPDALVVVDPDGEIVLANAEVERLLGWTRAELEGETLAILIPQAARAAHDRHRTRFLAHPQARRMGDAAPLTALTRSGDEIPVEVGLVPIRQDSTVYTIATIRDVRERLASETRLRVSESRFQGVFRNASLGMALLDKAGVVIEANDRMMELLGCDEAQIAGLHAGRAFGCGEKLDFGDLLADLESSGADVRETTVTLPGEAGGPVEIAVSLAAIRSEAEMPSTILLQLREVEETRRARRELAAAEAAYKRLVEEIPLVTYVQRADGAFDFVSPQVERLLGFPHESWLEDADFFENIVHPDDRAIADRRNWRVTPPTGSQAEYRLVGADGRVVWVEDSWTLEKDENDRPLSRRGFLLDVTERRRAESARQETERQLAHVFDGVSDALLMIRVEDGPTYRLLAANNAFRETTGQSRGEIAGRCVDEILDAERAGRIALRCEETIAMRAPNTFREEITATDGRRLTVETRLTPVFDSEGRCTHLLGASRDLTEREVLEARLRESQKLQAVGRLAGGVAHDFNNLLTVISFAGEELRRQFGEEPSSEVAHILEAAGRASRLTNQLLAFSRRQMMSPAELDLSEVVAELDTMLRRLIGEDIVLVTEVPRRPVGVLADRAQLEQIIVNLVINARDAMPDGGTIAISISTVEFGSTEARARDIARGRYACLTVVDDGVGMGKDVRAKLFEPFFTTKGTDGGSGLGLATVYGIVKQSNGAVDVDSAPGAGARFSIYLPLMKLERDLRRNGRETPPAPTAGAGTILLVEDEDLVRRLSQRVLVEAGYTVLAAGSGTAALELAASHDGPIDVAVTDVIMPGMNGRDFAARLQKLRPSARILYVSGYTADVIAQRGVLAEGAWFLEKPFTGASLTRKLREVLTTGAE